MSDIVLACASHSPKTLADNLAKSPAVRDGTLPLVVQKNAPSAAMAYNAAIDETDAPIIVFAHHDVYLPQGWDVLLKARIAELPEDWAVFGSFGIALDGQSYGPVWSSSLGAIVGRVPLDPVPVQAFDELLIVLRRDSGVRFDPELRSWHMYGTDIAQTALAAGRGAYAGALPCIHNDKSHFALDGDFDAAYRFMQRKWQDRLPLQTAVTKISRSGLHLWRGHWRNRRAAKILTEIAVETSSPVEQLASRCGWSVLVP